MKNLLDVKREREIDLVNSTHNTQHTILSQRNRISYTLFNINKIIIKIKIIKIIGSRNKG